MQRKRRLGLVLAALLLTATGCGQCAVGQGITQTMIIGSDATCLPIGLGFLCIMLALILMPYIGGGMGNGREG
jgi:hypothetical protein